MPELTMDDTAGKVYALLPSSQLDLITVHDIAEDLGLNDRSINDAITRLIIEYRKVIVGNRKPPYGMFVPQTEEERRIGASAYRAQINRMIKRYNCLMRNPLDTEKKPSILLDHEQLDLFPDFNFAK